MRHLIPVLCAAVVATSSALAQAPSAAPIPLPPWFHEIDTQKTGEVSRADFLKYRMESFEELDADKDGKLTVEEFVKVAEPPFTPDTPGGPTLEERRQHAREEFADLDTNRNGILERAEAEVIVHAEFNQYDLDRDNKVTEAEVRRAQRDLVDRQQVDQRRRDGATVNDYLDSRLREFDMLDTDRDGVVSQQEYLVLAGPPDGPATKDLLPFEMRRSLVLRKFQELDANKDRLLDRRELSLHAVREFTEMDSNKDRYLSEAEFKKAQEAEAARMFAAVQKAPAAPASSGTAPARPPPAGTPPRVVGSFEDGVKALQSGDAAAAEKELRGLADVRDPRAQYLLGLAVYGDPASKLYDPVKSAALLLEAAEYGYVPAMLPLAAAYAEGKGVPKSAFEACKWLVIADRWNEPNAGTQYEQAARALSPEDVDKAKAAALAYRFKTK